MGRGLIFFGVRGEVAVDQGEHGETDNYERCDIHFPSHFVNTRQAANKITPHRIAHISFSLYNPIARLATPKFEQMSPIRFSIVFPFDFLNFRLPF